jgi:hypothetical protein
MDDAGDAIRQKIVVQAGNVSADQPGAVLNRSRNARLSCLRNDSRASTVPGQGVVMLPVQHENFASLKDSRSVEVPIITAQLREFDDDRDRVARDGRKNRRQLSVIRSDGNTVWIVGARGREGCLVRGNFHRSPE